MIPIRASPALVALVAVAPLIVVPLFSYTWRRLYEDPLAAVCRTISMVISPASSVYYHGSKEYEDGISHWSMSSVQRAACCVEPGTPEDVGKVLEIVGRARAPFAVKGGGHAANPLFSSTHGVHIAMSRFRTIAFDPLAQTARVGAGLDWSTIYAALEAHNVSVVGARLFGIGVAGFTLGGGYSWKSNQHGLAIDNVLEFELVLPNGTLTRVSETFNSDLFFALRGGGNNFGIVTEFVLRTYPQTMVWGGVLFYPFSQQEFLADAISRFSSDNKDPKASLIGCFGFIHGQTMLSVLAFYDAPTVAPGIFEDFLEIPSIYKDISTRSYASLVASFRDGKPARNIFNPISTREYSPSILRALANESIFWSERLKAHSLTILAYSAQPFLPDVHQHSTYPSAWPPSRDVAFFPSNIHISWTDPAADDVMHDAARHSAAYLRSLVSRLGEHRQADEARRTSAGGSDTLLPQYPNYAIWDTSVEGIYGQNVGRLRAIRASVDPLDVMRLTGGFKL